MSSLTVMQAAVSSVNWALNVKPNLPMKSMDFFRSLTGRLAKTFGPCAFLCKLFARITSRCRSPSPILCSHTDVRVRRTETSS